jgi:hypothetical protein
MPTIQTESTLLDDVYLHSLVNSDGDVAVAQGTSGLLELFAIGTDGKVYHLVQDRHSQTGWKQTDLECPGVVDVIAACTDALGHAVVCVASERTLDVYARTLDGSAWHTIRPGSDVTGPLKLYELQLRIDAAGAVEFLLLYFQRLNEPEWQYRFRIGRSVLISDTWHIGFHVGQHYQGPLPTHRPTMTLGRAGGEPSLFLYWHEAETIRLWRGIDGVPQVEDLSLPDSSDYIRRLFALGDGARSELYAVGKLYPAAQDALYRYDWSGQRFTLLSTGVEVDDATGIYDASAGYDVIAVGRTGVLYHMHGSADGASWTPFTVMGGRASSVTGAHTVGEGSVFVVATQDHTLRRLYREPPHAQVDWQSEEIATQGSQGERVVWYTTTVSPLDAEQRPIGACAVTVSCPETTEVLINGRTEIVGPDRPLATACDAIGNLLIQQSTAELANLYVPQLTVTLPTQESTTLEPSAGVRMRLYHLTGEQLRDARGRAEPVLPAGRRGEADETARKLNTCASLGLAPSAAIRARMVSWESLGSPEPGRVQSDAGFIDVDLGDLFESIKDAVLQLQSIDITPVGDKVVSGLWLVLDTASGAFRVFVNTLEQAFDAARSVFDDVGAKFETVLEWLGTLFDWEAIKKVAADVRQMIRDGFAGIPAGLARAGLPMDIDAIFAELTRQANDALNVVRARVGAPSVGEDAKTAKFTNPGSLYTFDGKNHGNSANWLLDRMTPQLSAIGLSISLNDPGWAGFATMWTTVEQAIVGTGETVADGLTAFFQDLVTPERALSVSLDGIFDQWQSFVNGVLDAMKSIVTAMVGALETLAASTALTTLLDTPITIPVVSDLLASLGLGDTTVLDVVSYLIAIPMHVVQSIGTPVGLNGAPDAVPIGVFIACAAGFGILLVLSAVNDALPEAKQVLAVIMGLVWLPVCGLVLYGASTADDISIELWLAAFAYLAYQLIALRTTILYWNQREPTKKLAIYTIVDALFLNVLAAIWEARSYQNSDPKKHPKPWQVAANHVGTLPDLFRWVDLKWPPPPPPASKPLPVRVLLAAIDVVGMGALTAGAIADAIDQGSARVPTRTKAAMA